MDKDKSESKDVILMVSEMYSLINELGTTGDMIRVYHKLSLNGLLIAEKYLKREEQLSAFGEELKKQCRSVQASIDEAIKSLKRRVNFKSGIRVWIDIARELLVEELTTSKEHESLIRNVQQYTGSTNIDWNDILYYCRQYDRKSLDEINNIASNLFGISPYEWIKITKDAYKKLSDIVHTQREPIPEVFQSIDNLAPYFQIEYKAMKQLILQVDKIEKNKRCVEGDIKE